jgi:MFS family permease
VQQPFNYGAASWVNIALPSVQRSLGLSDPARQWVITIFALGYGGLLLLGGRLSDLIGRRRSLMIGPTGFALASALGGAAVDPAMLLTSRAAFGIYGRHRHGQLRRLGRRTRGVLTDYLDWRWCMYVNLPIAVAAGAGVLYAVRPVPRAIGVRVDIIGALLATIGLMR